MNKALRMAAIVVAPALGCQPTEQSNVAAQPNASAQPSVVTKPNVAQANAAAQQADTTASPPRGDSSASRRWGPLTEPAENSGFCGAVGALGFGADGTLVVGFRRDPESHRFALRVRPMSDQSERVISIEGDPDGPEMGQIEAVELQPDGSVLAGVTWRSGRVPEQLVYLISPDGRVARSCRWQMPPPYSLSRHSTSRGARSVMMLEDASIAVGGYDGSLVVFDKECTANLLNPEGNKCCRDEKKISLIRSGETNLAAPLGVLTGPPWRLVNSHVSKSHASRCQATLVDSTLSVVMTNSTTSGWSTTSEFFDDWIAGPIAVDADCRRVALASFNEVVICDAAGCDWLRPTDESKIPATCE